MQKITEMRKDISNIYAS
ncbi:Protein of unknown function [Bacillus wiedmannii]|uniref:Uncharacterized protein n=1 Tax=Bacillus wiedmannii TaxID=1890302 RepID=A0A1C4AS53_9BACI|nr:Protein of unknown function [Bacillus wiedmannii]